jgi:chromosome segregation ATPase
MALETLTYAELGARLAISSMAARSLAKQQRLPRSFSNDGKALVRVDLAELRHSPRACGRREPSNAAVTARITAMEAEIARLEALAARRFDDFEHERERADRLTIELSQANAEANAARDTTARLEGLLRTRDRTDGSTDSHGLAVRRPASLAADLVAADRRAKSGRSTSRHSRLPEKS